MKDGPSKRILNVWNKIRGGNYRFKKLIWNHCKETNAMQSEWLGRKRHKHTLKTLRDESLKISLFYLFSKHFIIFTKGQAFL